MELEVVLNGTNENPYHKFGLKQNPFSQLADARFDPYVLKLQSLGAEPIKDVQHIRKMLAGWSQEFVDLCCQKFEPGKMVRFKVSFRFPGETWREEVR